MKIYPAFFAVLIILLISAQGFALSETYTGKLGFDGLNSYVAKCVLRAAWGKKGLKVTIIHRAYGALISETLRTNGRRITSIVYRNGQLVGRGSGRWRQPANKLSYRMTITSGGTTFPSTGWMEYDGNFFVIRASTPFGITRIATKAN